MSFGAVAFGLSSFGTAPAGAATSVTGSGKAGSAAPTAAGTGNFSASIFAGGGSAVLPVTRILGAGRLDESAAAASAAGRVTANGAGLLGVTGSGVSICALSRFAGAGNTSPPGVGGASALIAASPGAAGTGLLGETGSASLIDAGPRFSGLGSAVPPGFSGNGFVANGSSFVSGSGRLEIVGRSTMTLVATAVLGIGQSSASPVVGAGSLIGTSSMINGTGLSGGGGMSGDRLQSLIYRRGYASLAAKAGLPYRQFRPAGPFDPMSGPPLGILPVLFGQDDRLQSPNLYGNAVWHVWIDGTATEVADILIGDRTFFIVAQQPLLPILAVEAPRTVDVSRPFHQTRIGFSPIYGGTIPALETVIMRQWPASILQGGGGDSANAALPDEVRALGWSMLLPQVPGVVLRPSDVVSDELGRRYTIASAELTSFGWRLTIHQAES
ncbi:MAG TPA: hypothetical protein VM689_20640 [Aliidongia sp.]|nr:hypothetical protein [Aliidongia sp.]